MSLQVTAMLVEALKIFARDPQQVGRLLEQLGIEMPNIPMKTMGGHVFWENLAEADGWRLQRNWVFGNCRILDPNNMRRAWGGRTALVKAFETLVKAARSSLH